MITPYAENVFGATLLTNKYENGQGVMTFDGDVTSIGDLSFYMLSKLTSITIPEGVTEIGYGTFSGCTSLKKITIPSSVTTVSAYAFSYCPALSEITCEAKTAPTTYAGSFGYDTTTYTGRRTYSAGTNKLYVPSGATGYEDSYWGSDLLDSDKCGFTMEESLDYFYIKNESNNID